MEGRDREVEVDEPVGLEVRVEGDADEPALAGRVDGQRHERGRQEGAALDDAEGAALLGDEDSAVRGDGHLGGAVQPAGEDGLGEPGRQRGGDGAVFEGFDAERGAAHGTRRVRGAGSPTLLDVPRIG